GRDDLVEAGDVLHHERDVTQGRDVLVHAQRLAQRSAPEKTPPSPGQGGPAKFDSSGRVGRGRPGEPSTTSRSGDHMTLTEHSTTSASGATGAATVASLARAWARRARAPRADARTERVDS